MDKETNSKKYFLGIMVRKYSTKLMNGGVIKWFS